jgi:carboxypeptidase Taq
MDSYDKLCDRAAEVALLSSTASLLSWDQEIHLPPRALEYRGSQLAWLSGRAHETWVREETGAWLEEAGEKVAPGSDEAVNVERWTYDYERARKLPVELVERSARLESQAHEAWKEAREKSDYSIFSPLLAELIDISREKGERWGYAECPYDALMESYEPGFTASEARALFVPLAAELAELFKTGASDLPVSKLPDGPYPVEQQVEFNRKVIEAVGFDFSRGRVDTAVHPFSTTMGPYDNRITTRFNEEDFTFSFFGILHECGHGMYEQGLPAEKYGTPCGGSVSLGIHESQSRLWENQIGRSRAFWEYWYPVANDHFPQLKSMSLDDFVRFVNKVEKSFIRVDASELGYDLHVILRFEVEEKIFSGELEVEGVPSFWNQRFKELIGLDVPDDRRGCLQDIHWSMGGFGYFPTYTLGSLNAAQLLEAVRQRVPNFEQELKRGETGNILDDLRRNIHAHGRRYLPKELIEVATGNPPAPAYLLDYFRNKLKSLMG